MNLLEFTKATFTALSEFDDCLRDTEIEPGVQFADIWDACHIQLKELYKLPDLSLTGEGFTQGNATATECIDTARIVRKQTKKDVYFYHCSEYTLFSFLDDQFIKLMEPEVKNLVASYQSYCQGYLNTTLNHA